MGPKTELETIQEQLPIKRQELLNVTEQLADGRQTLRRLGERAREYEEGMREIRKADEKRQAELDDHDMKLSARERALTQKEADFEKRKRRWQQLKDMQ